jgi:hypothetical protein
MGTKVVDPKVPTSVIQRAVDELPALPQAEARRLRRAVRGAADVVLPQIFRRLVDIALNTEDEKLAADLGWKLMGMSVKGKANEEVDPDGPEVLGEVVGKDPLKELEDATAESGDGKGT